MWVISGGLNFSSKRKKKKKKKRVELPAKASNFFIYFLGINRLLFSLSLFSFFQCKVIENQNPNIKPLQE